jgi:2-furoyl-CoA dehydrogenase large subunit
VNVHGSRTLASARAAVFDAICDPETLLAVIPGCRAIERVGETEYRGEIALRLPGIVGTYRTTVRLVETDRPEQGRLEGEVVGSLGTIEGLATFRLTETPDNGTTVEYDGQARISGPLARLDGRFVEGLAGSLIGQGLDNLDARLQRTHPVGVGDARQPAKEIPE